MIKVYQTRINNCSDACLASLLECDINEVPVAQDTKLENKNWLLEYNKFCKTKDKQIIYLPDSSMYDLERLGYTGLVMVGIRYPAFHKEDQSHAIIVEYKNGVPTIVHNPMQAYKERQTLDNRVCWGIIIVKI